MRNNFIIYILIFLMVAPVFSQKKENTKKKIVDKETEVEALENVNVKGRSRKQKTETKGFAVNVIETKEASLRNIQTNELLNQTAGVRVRQNGGLGSFVEYNLNGMAGSAIGIFIDGIAISTYGSSFNLNTIPPAMIERIEVYKGVMPIHLSGDLLGGAINIVLKKGGLKNSLNVSTSYGSFNTVQTDINGMYRDGKTGFTAKASGFFSYSDNDYEVWGKFVKNKLSNTQEVPVRAKRFDDVFRSYGSNFQLGYSDVKWANNFMIGYTGSNSYKEVQHGQYMKTPYKGRFVESQANIVTLKYNKRNLFVKGLDFDLNAVHSYRTQYIQDTVKWVYNWYGEKVLDFYEEKYLISKGGAQQANPTMATIDRKITNIRTDFQYRIAKNHKLEWNNLFYVANRNDYDALLTILEQNYQAKSNITKDVISLGYEIQAFKSRLKTNLFGKYYWQKVERMDPKVAVVNGENVRIEQLIDDTRTTTGYGFATSYTITPNLYIMGSGEHAVNMPSESQVFGNQSENLIGNPNLKPEISDNFNLGFKLDSYKIGKHQISVSASGFIRDTKDKIVALSNDRGVDNISTFPFENLGATQAIGFEAEINYVFKNLNVMVNMSKFNSLFKTKFNGLKIEERYNVQLPNEPFFTTNGNLQYTLNNLLQKKSTLNLFYFCGYVAPYNTIWQKSDAYMTPSQFIQDLGMSYRFPNKKFVVSFDAKNILNRESYDNYAAQKPGRAFYLKLSYTINKF